MSCQPPVTYADPRDVGELAEPLRSRVAQLIGDAPGDGLLLVSGMRSPYQQWLLRHERCPGQECDRACRGRPLTAVPYASRHQRGEAADLGGRALRWAGTRASDYGLVRPVPGEPWHFEAAPWSPRVPVRTWRPPHARSWAPVRPGDTDRIVANRGGQSNQVTELQLRLTAMHRARRGRGELDPGPADGIYGPRSISAVRAFKLHVIALQQLTGQETWPNADGLVGQRTIDMLRWWTP